MFAVVCHLRVARLPLEEVRKRKGVLHFGPKPIPGEVVFNLIGVNHKDPKVSAQTTEWAYICKQERFSNSKPVTIADIYSLADVPDKADQLLGGTNLENWTDILSPLVDTGFDDLSTPLEQGCCNCWDWDKFPESHENWSEESESDTILISDFSLDSLCSDPVFANKQYISRKISNAELRIKPWKILKDLPEELSAQAIKDLHDRICERGQPITDNVRSAVAYVYSYSDCQSVTSAEEANLNKTDAFVAIPSTLINSESQIVAIDKSSPEWQISLKDRRTNEILSALLIPQAFDGDPKCVEKVILQAFKDDSVLRTEVVKGRDRNLITYLSR